MSGSVRVTEAGDDAAAEWDGFVSADRGGSLYHAWAWRRHLEAESGQPCHYLLARDARGRVCGVLPLARLKSRLFGDFLVSLPYLNYGGVVAGSPEAEAALTGHAVELARRLRVSHLELREAAPRDGWPVRTDKVAMLLDLAASEDEQWKALGSKLRAQIRRPLRENPSMRFGGAELVEDFYRVFSRNMRDLGTPVYARGFFERIAADPATGAALAVAYVAGRPAAAGFLVSGAGTTEIPWASSLREWNRTGINMYLYWEILKHCIRRGDRRFDFGRSSVGGGTYRFKAQWGARPKPLFWNYWLAPGRGMPGLTPANPKFSAAIGLWRRLPVWAANRLGPPIVRRLP